MIEGEELEKNDGPLSGDIEKIRRIFGISRTTERPGILKNSQNFRDFPDNGAPGDIEKFAEFSGFP